MSPWYGLVRSWHGETAQPCQNPPMFYADNCPRGTFGTVIREDIDIGERDSHTITLSEKCVCDRRINTQVYILSFYRTKRTKTEITYFEAGRVLARLAKTTVPRPYQTVPRNVQPRTILAGTTAP